MRLAMPILMRPIVLAAVSAALISQHADAFQPLITDDTGTQGAGRNQMELSYNRTSERAPAGRERVHELPFVFTRGITEALDLYVGAGYLRIDPDGSSGERGWGNPVFGAKWRVYDDEASKLSFALKPQVRIPVSEAREARGLGTGRLSYGAGLLASKETGFGALHANLAAERINYADAALDASERRTRYRLSVAPVWDVSDTWKLALDAGLVTNPDRSAKRYMGYIEAGAIYSHSKDLDFALGIIRNVRDAEVRTTQLTLGVTLRYR
jgi:hypothetical protein